MDWKKIRVEMATAFGQAMINGLSYPPSPKDVAESAVNYADELIKKLKEQE
jgi:hypothetical protein